MLLREIFSIQSDNPVLVKSQFVAFSKQIPVMYGILVLNTAGLAATHLSVAPMFLSFGLPCLLCIGCAIRLSLWLASNAILVTPQEAASRLRSSVWVAGFFSLVFSAWALSLYPFGGIAEKCHVAFYMSITAITCIFCLMQVRGAALLLTVIVVTPFTAFFLATRQPVFIAMAVNFLLVVAGMLFILFKQYRDFQILVVSQQILLERQCETQILSDENQRLANSDSLTELPNRRQFMNSLQSALAQASQHDRTFALALIDVDGFKGVNDVYGHSVGDQLLVEVGRRLKGSIRQPAMCARLGGDEFGVLYTDNPTISDVATLGDELSYILSRPYLKPELCVEAPGSIGLAIYPTDGVSAEQLLERADYALYHAKKVRRGEAVTFSAELESSIHTRNVLDQALRNADLEREFWLAYQPIVDTKTNAIIGFEALARWSSPSMGDIEPSLFIPIAEKTQLIRRLTHVLLTKALKAAALWPEIIRISFNLSAEDLSSPKSVDVIRQIILSSGISSCRIDLEITETALMSDFIQTESSICLLRELGVSISLDDFGTGFSSLNYMLRLRPDKIKVDRSFVGEIDLNPASREIVGTILELCRNLKIDCIVEGVEKAEQAESLSELGCRIMQGFLYGQPVPDTEVLRLINLGPGLIDQSQKNDGGGDADCRHEGVGATFTQQHDQGPSLAVADGVEF